MTVNVNSSKSYQFMNAILAVLLHSDGKQAKR